MAVPPARGGFRAIDVAAVTIAIALIPLGWTLYVAKLLDLLDRGTLDEIARDSLLVSGAVAGVALLVRLPPAAGVALAGFALAPAAAGVDASPLLAAFAYGTALLVFGWLLVRRRPAASAPTDVRFLRGRGGATLVVLAPALVALAAFSGLAAWIRVLGTLAALVAGGTWLRLAEAGWRLVAGFLTVLALALIVLEVFMLYDLYALLPVALAAGLFFLAGIPFFLAVASGRAPLPRGR